MEGAAAEAAAAHAAPPEYSCHCLNVTIAPASELQPAAVDQPEFLRVRVAEDGIAIAHPQLTLRDRAKPSEPTVQHVSLICLVCNQLVYRVAHAIKPGLEARDGPVVPTAEWAEQEVLRSASGIIDLARGCLSGEALRRARESGRFSDTFGIIVTAAPPPDPLVPQPHGASASSASSAYAMNPLPTPALFAPSPFSPSHTAFAYLAQRARARSDCLRHGVETDLAALISARLLDLDASDRALKAEVEAIWRAFPEDPLALVHGNATMSFTELPVRVARRTSLSSQSQQLPQVSLLSASLRQTGIRVPPHVPERAPGDDRSSSPPLYDDDSDNNDEDPSRPPRCDGFSASSLPAQIRRNMDPNLDISTSFRFESDLAKQQQAADAADRQARQERRDKKKVQRERESVNVSRPSTSAAPAPLPVVVSPPRASAMKTNGRTQKDQGKRKVVTFEEKPQVLVIPQRAPSPSPPPQPQQPPAHAHIEEMGMFEMDGLDEAHPALPAASAHVNGTAARAPSRALNGRVAQKSALLASLSYRAPSALASRPPAVTASAPPAPAPLETFKPYKNHLLGLVCADLRSHRDSWKIYARGRRGRDGALSDGDAGTADPEDEGEDEDPSSDDDEAPAQPPQGYASSLPIPIGPISSLARAARRPFAPALETLPEEADAAAGAANTARQRAIDILRADVPDSGIRRGLP